MSYAVRDERGEEILIRTTSPHPRAAMVNWLTLTTGVPVPASMPAEQIKAIFVRLSAKLSAQLVRVSVDVREVVDAAEVEVSDD